MKRLFYLCSLALLAVCFAGCGKDTPADSAENPAEGADFNTLMQNGVAAVSRNDAAAATSAAAQALELQPGSAEAHLLAGQAACLRTDYKKAGEYFNAVIEEKSLPAALRAKAYVGRGIVEFEQRDADLARITLLHALLLDESNEAAYYYLGRIYRDIYQFNEASKEQFEKYVKYAGQQPAAQKVKDRYLPELGAAIKRATAARLGSATRNSELSAKLLAEAQALEKRNSLRDAKKKYKAARDADPLSAPAALGFARVQKRLDSSSGGVGEALTAYRAAIDSLPTDGKEWYKAIMEAGRLAYATKERWATVVKIMDRAVAHYPKEVDSLDLLIGAHRKAGSTKLFNAWIEYRKELKK